MNSYNYLYRVTGGEWVMFSAWTPPTASAQLIAADAACDYWYKHQPPEISIWPLSFEIEGRGTFDVDVEVTPVFVARRSTPPTAPTPDGEGRS